MNLAISGVKVVPGAMIAVPCASPLGIGPASALAKRTVSSGSVLVSRSSTLFTIVSVPG